MAVKDEELIEEEFAEDTSAEDNSERVEGKPTLEFEDEFEIITDDAELEPEPSTEVVEKAREDESSIDARIQQALSSAKDDKFAEALKGIQTALTPPAEKPKAIDWEAKYGEIATQLSEDPAKAVKELKDLMTTEISGAFQYQQGQIMETQRKASKIIAQGDPSLKMAFEKWGDEVETAAKDIKPASGQSVDDVYKRAAQMVMSSHLDEVIDAKMEEKLRTMKGVRPAQTKLSSNPGQPAEEGRAKKPVYKFRPQDIAWADKQINPVRAKQWLIQKGRATKVR